MRAKVVSVAIDPAAPQHGTLTGTGQWQLSIKTTAQVLTHTTVILKHAGTQHSELCSLAINTS